MIKKIFIILFIFIGWLQRIVAQDPHFSQFFMAPQFMNPAIVGTSPSDWLIMSNLRQQWGNAGTPFNTQTIAGEVKFRGKEVDENTIGAGVALMSDQSMNGAFRSVYFSSSLAYHAILSENSRLGIGFQGNYGNRKIDYSQLTFGEQFTSGGFDVTLPTGETAISNMKPYFSIGAGLLFNHKVDNMNIDVGVAAFHINRPQQTFLSDGNERIPLRVTGHINMECQLSEGWVLNINSCYQRQAKPSYFAIGGALGKDVSDGDFYSILYAGGWFREGDSFYPYVGWLKGNVQIGFTYDITHSKQNQGPYIPKSFETSIVIKKKNYKPGVIPCPWR